MMFPFAVTVLSCLIYFPVLRIEVADTMSAIKLSEKIFDAINKEARIFSHDIDKKSQKGFVKLFKRTGNASEKTFEDGSISGP